MSLLRILPKGSDRQLARPRGTRRGTGTPAIACPGMFPRMVSRRGFPAWLGFFAHCPENRLLPNEERGCRAKPQGSPPKLRFSNAIGRHSGTGDDGVDDRERIPHGCGNPGRIGYREGIHARRTAVSGSMSGLPDTLLAAADLPRLDHPLPPMPNRFCCPGPPRGKRFPFRSHRTLAELDFVGNRFP